VHDCPGISLLLGLGGAPREVKPQTKLIAAAEPLGSTFDVKRLRGSCRGLNRKVYLASNGHFDGSCELKECKDTKLWISCAQ
jgi:hypothetical protein